MKLIIVGTAHPYRGGLAAFNERLALQFLSEGHQVKIYTFILQYPSFLFPGKTQYTSDPAPEGLEIVRAVNSCNPFNWISVGRRIRAEKADIVIFAYWMSFMAPCFGTIARFCNSKCIGLIHNMIPHEPNVMDKIFPGYFIKAMKGFTALSESVLDDIRKFDKAGRKKTWAPHPVYDHYGSLIPKSEARSLLGLPESGRIVLFFGFIRDYKGLDILLEAFGRERLKSSDINLLVAGEFYGSSAPYLEQISRLGVEGKVDLRCDFIPEGEVNRYFCAADIVVQPYKSATQSGVTQIAYHFEKPMIVTRVGGLPEIVPDGKMGFVVDPDPAQIERAVLRFYDEELEAPFIEGLREEKSKYTWSQMSRAIIDAAL